MPYLAGSPSFGFPCVKLRDKPPASWTVEIVDLYRDFGAFRLTGLSLGNAGGESMFDCIYLAGDAEALRRLSTKRN